MELTSLQIADLYKNRWQIEPFFKWLKQHFKIKKFWGTTENAVRIQISVAIITYCLVAIVQYDMQLKRSTYEVLQILSMFLTDTTHLRNLFDKTTFKNDKDRSGSSEPDFLKISNFNSSQFLEGPNESESLKRSQKDKTRNSPIRKVQNINIFQKKEE